LVQKLSRPPRNESRLQQRLSDAAFASRAQAWDDRYSASDVYSIIHQRRLAMALTIADGLHLPSETDALDAGCGAGFMSIGLAGLGARVLAVDTVSQMLDNTRRNVQKRGLGERVKLARADAANLPLSDERFGLVVALGLVPWVPSPPATLAELTRVLEPGGYLILSASNSFRLTCLLDPMQSPLLASLRRGVKKLLRRGRAAPPRRRVSTHSRKELDLLLSSAGLRAEAWLTLGFGPFKLFRAKVVPNRIGVALHRRLQSLANHGFPGIRWMGSQHVVLATKPVADPAKMAQAA
jgi:ubiquinone/menaquinone biosynthesis C-methylase UbiE